MKQFRRSTGDAPLLGDVPAGSDPKSAVAANTAVGTVRARR